MNIKWITQHDDRTKHIQLVGRAKRVFDFIQRIQAPFTTAECTIAWFLTGRRGGHLLHHYNCRCVVTSVEPGKLYEYDTSPDRPWLSRATHLPPE